MGKWTPTHYDDVLVSKIKSLVSGAIERSKLEKTEPLISYESFVEELDARDSFTTSVIEILVKELAERRTRGSGQDGGVIADRTAKSLRNLSNSIRIYRSGSRRHISRRTLPGALTEYLSSPPHEILDDDDEDFRSMLDMTNGSSAIEGARVNSDLYEAYGGGNGQHSSWAGSGLVFSTGMGRRHSLSPLSASTDERASPPPPRAFSPISLPPSPPTMRRSPPARMFPTPAASISSSNAARIRRPQQHSRTVDFSQFSSRRRSLNREAAESSAPREESGPTQASSTTTRRFFPFSRFQPSRWGVSRIWSDLGEDEPHESSTGEPTPSSPAWNSAVYPAMLTHDEIERYSSESVREPWIPSHPLRRGGVRAPESMLSRHVSPVPVLAPPETSGPSSGSTTNNNADQDNDPTPAAGYPTPGSAGHESS